MRSSVDRLTVCVYSVRMPPHVTIATGIVQTAQMYSTI